MKKKILLRSLLGAPVGVTISSIISIVISLCAGHGEYVAAPSDLIVWCGGNETVAVIVQAVCSMIIGALFSGASVVWEIENWSLTKQTLIHFAVFISFIPISYVLNWMPHDLIGALCYTASFIFTYVIIWVSTYFPIKAKIKKMNKQLRELQQEDNEKK